MVISADGKKLNIKKKILLLFEVVGVEEEQEEEVVVVVKGVWIIDLRNNYQMCR